MHLQCGRRPQRGWTVRARAPYIDSSVGTLWSVPPDTLTPLGLALGFCRRLPAGSSRALLLRRARAGVLRPW
jgi:hypothetical protein